MSAAALQPPVVAMPLLRPARGADARRIGAILSEALDGAGDMPRPHSPAEDLGFCCRLIGRGGVTVAEAGRVIGFMAVSGAELEALYLDASWRGRGVGGLLLRAAQASVPRLELWTHAANRRARRFYLRHGFTEIAGAMALGASRAAQGLPDIRYCWDRGVT